MSNNLFYCTVVESVRKKKTISVKCKKSKFISNSFKNAAKKNKKSETMD